ncbi:substrate-binding domain-containing protein [Paenibacillus sp. MMS18-CY102]|uniref:substrate-binding domain-containing protein n=1 Tax=Paenibacillus sp. MMS18-CY102 TaxID=2682849 RepID=UPI001365B2E8|nr:substrate-binding domain-containing protein [Paenibacillus sp. MMS18-CY102]MWC30971.1 substrate-binding domain-containing protein [Paenibacillus sp. MMS18-CY102]
MKLKAKGFGRWRIGTVLLFLLVLILLPACAASQLTSEAPETPRRIVLVAPVHASEQGEAMRLGADAAAKEFDAQLEYIAFEPSDDADEQLAAALRAVNDGVSAILIDPATEQVLSEVAAKASAKGMPVVTLNDVRQAKGVQAAVSVDNEEAGRQAGEAMAKLLNGRGTVVILRSDRIDPDLVQRESGIRAVLASYSGISMAQSGACGNQKDACWEAAKQLLDGGRIDGALALESTGSFGLSNEVKRLGKQGQIKLVAFGSDTGQLELLQDGVIQQLVVQNGFSTGYLGVQQAVSLLSNARDDKPILLETKVINADNMFWMTNQKMLFPFIQ